MIIILAVKVSKHYDYGVNQDVVIPQTKLKTF